MEDGKTPGVSSMPLNAASLSVPPDNVMPVPPNNTGVRLFKTYQSGSTRSQQRLNQLKHDPILKLVKAYWKLEAELKRQEDLRDAPEVIALDENGKRVKAPKNRYSPDVHMRCYEQMIKVNESLMRYGYGRVPEASSGLETPISPLTIELTSRNGVFEAEPAKE